MSLTDVGGLPRIREVSDDWQNLIKGPSREPLGLAAWVVLSVLLN